MEQLIDNSDEMTLILTNKNNNQYICEFEVNFQKTIHLSQPSEIGIQEISLPSNLKVNKFFRDYNFKMTILWDKSFESSEIYDEFKSDETENFDLEEIYEKTCVLESSKRFVERGLAMTISGDFDMYDTNFYLINDYFKKRFPSHDLTSRNQFEYIPPKLIFQDDKHYKNQVGEINVKGGQTNSSKKSRVAYIFLNFEFELHKILGFDPNLFPNVKIKDNKPIQLDNGLATNIANIDSFDVVYVYTNIVRETYVGPQKVNILKVFAQTQSRTAQNYYQFENVFFVPIRIDEINSIKIAICDSNGQIPTYQKGEITITLLIRPSA